MDMPRFLFNEAGAVFCSLWNGAPSRRLTRLVLVYLQRQNATTTKSLHGYHHRYGPQTDFIEIWESGAHSSAGCPGLALRPGIQ